VIDGLLAYYQISFDETVLTTSLALSETVINEFMEPKSSMCYFTPASSTLIARKMEINDNVIPASNSVMARNFFTLGKLYYRKDLLGISRQMLANIYDGMEQYGSGYSNWAILLLDHVRTHYQVVVLGENAEILNRELQQQYLPQAIFAGGKSSTLPIAVDKVISSATTTIFVCYDGTCLLPTGDVGEAVKAIKN